MAITPSEQSEKGVGESSAEPLDGQLLNPFATLERRDGAFTLNSGKFSGTGWEAQSQSLLRPVRDSLNSGDLAGLQNNLQNLFGPINGDPQSFQNLVERLDKELKPDGIAAKLSGNGNELELTKGGNSLKVAFKSQLDLDTGKVDTATTVSAPDGRTPEDTISKFANRDKPIRLAQGPEIRNDAGPQLNDKPDSLSDIKIEPGQDSVVDPKTGLRIELKGASKEFIEQRLKEIDRIPEHHRALLHKNGVKIQIIGSIAQDRPDFASENARGSNVTFNNRSGAYSYNDKSIIVAERKIDENTGQFVPNPRPDAVLWHETGHALDTFSNNIVNSKEFREAYRKDVSKISTADKAVDGPLKGYYFQKGFDGTHYPGRSETFADVYAAILGNPTLSNAQDILTKFPEVSKLIRERLKMK